MRSSYLKKTIISAPLMIASISSYALPSMLVKTLDHLKGTYLNISIGMGGIQSSPMKNTAYFNNNENVRDGASYLFNAGYLIPIFQSFQVGAEIGHANYPTNSYHIPLQNYPDIQASYHGYYSDLLAVTTYQPSDDFALVFKAGAADTHQQFSTSFNKQFSNNGQITAHNYNKTVNKILPEVDFGVNYNLTQHFALTTNLKFVFSKDPTPLDINDLNATKDEIGLPNSPDSYNKTASVFVYTAGFSYLF